MNELKVDSSASAIDLDTFPQLLRNTAPNRTLMLQAADIIEKLAQSVDLVLYCPRCGVQHLDGPGGVSGDADGLPWTDPRHRTHLCRIDQGGCGFKWRPSDRYTNGVQAAKSRGRNDDPVRQTTMVPKWTKLHEQDPPQHELLAVKNKFGKVDITIFKGGYFYGYCRYSQVMDDPIYDTVEWCLLP